MASTTFSGPVTSSNGFVSTAGGMDVTAGDLDIAAGDLLLGAGGVTLEAAGVKMKSAKVTITAAELKALAATQIALVAAVTGSYLVFHSAILELDKGATAYDDAAADGNLVIRYTNGSGAAVCFVEADGFIDAVADAAVVAYPNDDVAGAANVPKVPVVSAALVLDNDGTEYTTGDGELHVVVNYFEVASQL